MDGETATAIRRVYNRWLGDYCQEIGRGACGAASIDLRDPALAAAEVRRCVKEYDFKAAHMNPAPVPDLRLGSAGCAFPSPTAGFKWVETGCPELPVQISRHETNRNAPANNDWGVNSYSGGDGGRVSSSDPGRFRLLPLLNLALQTANSHSVVS